MITRIRHGVPQRPKADDYLRLLRARAIPAYQAVPGNQAALVLRRDEGDKTHFLTLSLWSSLDAIRGLAGDDVERAVYFPEDAEYLLEFEPTVAHYHAYATATD